MRNRFLTWILAATLALLSAPAVAVDDLQDYSTTPASNVDIGGNTMAEGMPPSAVNNGVRELISQLKRAVANQGSDIASASTTAICATGTSAYAKVTGTTTITSFGTAAAGCSRWITFTGALILTHNGTSLILPGAANFTTAAGDMIWAVSEGSGNWRVRVYPANGTSVVPNSNGVHKLWVPASAMRPATGTPPASADNIGSARQWYTLDFDQSSIEIAHFNLSMPSSWNEGTCTFIPVWTAASSSGDVIWALQGVAISNDDVLSGTYSTTVTSTDTLIATGDLHRGPQSSALTIEGSPAAKDLVLFRFFRSATAGGDTLAADASLLGIELFCTFDEAVDVP